MGCTFDHNRAIATNNYTFTRCNTPWNWTHVDVVIPRRQGITQVWETVYRTSGIDWIGD